MAAGYPVPHERDHVMSSTAKPYQKPHQKQQQFPKPHQKHHQQGWQQPELPFDDKPWREPALTDTEIKELFWRKLVQLGWRLETYGDVATRQNIVLPCPFCYNKLESILWESVTPTSARRMSNSQSVKRIIEQHGGLVCKPVAEDEPED